MKRVGSLMVAVAVVLIALPAMGTNTNWEIVLPFDVQRGDPGSEKVLWIGPIPESIVGQECTITATGKNNYSVHPGNDLHFDSGGESVVLVDVEREKNASTTGTSSIVLGESGTVTLIFGEDEIYSAGLTLEFECRPPETTTTTTTDSTTTTAPTTTSTSIVETTTTTTSPSTTVSQPPPTSTTTPEELPFTGSETTMNLPLAIGLMVAGLLTLGLATRFGGEKL